MTWTGVSGRDAVGIASMSYYVPRGVVTSAEMSRLSGVPLQVFLEKIGMEQKHIAAEDEHPTDMGVRAAENAVRKAGVDPSEIGYIAYCGASLYDYRFWSPAAKIQNALGADDCYAFEIRNVCNGGNLGINICRNLLLGDPDKRYALVVCSEKLSISVDYADPDALSLYMMGDGAAAALLKRSDDTNRLLSYASLTNGSMADSVKVPIGGTRLRYVPGISDERLGHIRVADPAGLDRILSRVYLENYVKVIQKALDKSGYTVEDVDLLLTNQVKKSLLEDILQSLGLAEEHTMISIKDYGHMGSVDTLFNLSRAMEEGRIGPGSLVVLASSGAGFTWAAMPVEFR